MIPPRDFIGALKKNGFSSFTGVPCSFFQAAINCVIDDPDLRYTIVPNEGAALALASGAYLAGTRTALMIQNSGFGNLVNPLTSLNMIYRIPVLIFMSARAYGVPDEPQHEIIGRTMGPLLGAIGVPYRNLPEDPVEYQKALGEALAAMERQKLPYFFFVKRGAIDEYTPHKNGRVSYPLKRIEAIQIIAGVLKGDEIIVATTGKPSRELFKVFDRKGNFYMQGSMGHAASIGLGVAMNRPSKKVIVLDGDGAILMHLGILSTVGHYKPQNFYHVILDNESYETTGDQDTTSPTTDLKQIASACGYARVDEAVSASELEAKLAGLLKRPGPALLRVKVNRLPTPDIPRISTKYTSEEIAEVFRSQVTA